MRNRLTEIVKNCFQLKLKQIFFCIFSTIFIVFFVLGGFCGYYLKNIHSTIFEKSQTEKYLQSTVKKMEFQILDLMYAVSLYLEVGSEETKQVLDLREKEFLKTVERFEEKEWIRDDKIDTEELVSLTKRIHKRVENFILLQSHIHISFFEVTRFIKNMKKELKEEKRKILPEKGNYTQKLKLVLRLETYVESISALVAYSLIRPDNTFYQGMYDIERDCGAIFEAEEGAKQFLWQGIKQLSLGFDTLIHKSYKLVKLRESKAQLLEHFRKDTEKVVSLLREKIIIMAVDRNQRVQESINQSLLRLFFVFFALIFITFILGCFFYVFLMHVITQPLVRLTEKVQRFSLLGDDGGGVVYHLEVVLK